MAVDLAHPRIHMAFLIFVFENSFVFECVFAIVFVFLGPPLIAICPILVCRIYKKNVAVTSKFKYKAFFIIDIHFYLI